MKATWKKHILRFKNPSGTSRGVLYEKPSWFIILESASGTKGIGECGMLPGLSMDDKEGYDGMLQSLVDSINNNRKSPDLTDWPSIKFGLEMALLDLENGGNQVLFPSEFTLGNEGILINGLVWMASAGDMLIQVEEKLKAGYTCVKLKIGAIDFVEELKLIKHIRANFPAKDITIRVDANGAFSPENALQALDGLAALGVHSIEQPIKAGQVEEMARLCEISPLPIALDEELIGIHTAPKRAELMNLIKPQAIILKPSFLGGFAACDHWISLAGDHSAIWWITSALESNIGLNAVAQYTFQKHSVLHQGLGTGQLYTNNFESPLAIENGKLYSNPSSAWNHREIS